MIDLEGRDAEAGFQGQRGHGADAGADLPGEGAGGRAQLLEDPLALLFSLAQMGVGAPYVMARMLGYEAGLVTSPTYEYGNTFTAVAGLLNILILLDALDTARGIKDRRPPAPEVRQ